MSRLSNLPSPATLKEWQNPRLQGRISELDGLRGLAILFVIVWHYIACLVVPAPGSLGARLMLPLQIAWSGVDLFFVLSGFLIGGILLDARSSPRYFKTFYMRRLHRIFPLYYLWLATFGIALALPLPDYLSKLFNQELPWWSYPLYVQNIFMAVRQRFGAEWLGMTWSLAVEEQFYLILPLVVRILRPANLAKFIIGAILAAPVLRLAIYWSGNEYYGPYTLLPCRADSLGCGVLCALLLRRQAAWEWLVRRRGYVYSILAILAGGVVFLWSHSQGRIMNSIGYTWLALFYSTWLILAVVQPDRAVRALLNHPLIQRCGLLAYGLYMFHQGINSLLHGLVFRAPPVIHGISTALVTGLAAALTFVAASLSWKYFEKPLVARGQSRYSY